MSNHRMDPAFASLDKRPREVLRDAGAAREALTVARKKAGPVLAGMELDIHDHFVPFADREDQQVPIRIYRPKDVVSDLPVLLYFHGGGFFCGDLFSEEWQCAHYAHGAQCAVVCVDYRLAPENPFPRGLTDCYRVLEFLWQQGETLKLGRNLIAVGGSSAGANLAAAVCFLARDQKGPPIIFQMLLVPVLDDRLETPSARGFTEVPDFARPEAETMWRWYLGENVRDVSLYAAPGRATDLSSLPATYILCAGLDPLRDEGIDYARRLAEAGVAVEHHLVPSIPHGFASVPSAAITKRMLREQIEVLRSAFYAKQSTL